MDKISLSAVLAIFTTPLFVGCQQFTSPGNPILGDGSVYSADLAPLAVGNQVHILAVEMKLVRKQTHLS
jgi:hypothetical protein